MPKDAQGWTGSIEPVHPVTNVNGRPLGSSLGSPTWFTAGFDRWVPKRGFLERPCPRHRSTGTDALGIGTSVVRGSCPSDAAK